MMHKTYSFLQEGGFRKDKRLYACGKPAAAEYFMIRHGEVQCVRY